MQSLINFSGSLIPPLILSFSLSFSLVPIIIFFSHKFQIVDYPNTRRVNPYPTPRLGGLVLFFSFLAIFFMPRLVEHQTLILIPGLITIALAGLLDDLFSLSPTWQAFSQILAALVTIYFGTSITQLGNPFDSSFIYLQKLSFPFTLLWILVFINAINWLDGLDGLATSVIIIASLIIANVSLKTGSYTNLQNLIILSCCLAGFLFWNYPPAKIFLGTMGIYLIGYSLSIFAIQESTKIATSLIVLSIPIYDLVITIIKRILQKKRIDKADQNHLFHNLKKIGWSNQVIVLTFSVITLILGLLALKFHTYAKIILAVFAFLLLITGALILYKKILNIE